MHIRPAPRSLNDARLNSEGLRHIEVRLHLEAPRKGVAHHNTLSVRQRLEGFALAPLVCVLDLLAVVVVRSVRVLEEHVGFVVLVRRHGASHRAFPATGQSANQNQFHVFLQSSNIPLDFDGPNRAANQLQR